MTHLRLLSLLCLLVVAVIAGESAPAPAFARPKPASAPKPARLAAEVGRIAVLPDKAPDCSTLKSIAESVTRGCTSNDDKAIAIYNFMNLSHYHFKGPNELGGLPVLKEINTYGWSLCGALHAEQSALWRELGWGWRFVGWDGHTTVEAQYDGRWHYLDVFLKYYAWMPDGAGGRTIAGQDDLAAKPKELVEDVCVLDPARKVVYAKGSPPVADGKGRPWAVPFLSCGDLPADVVGGVKTRKVAGSQEGWNDVVHATGNYSTDINLAPGLVLTNSWEPVKGANYWNHTRYTQGHTCKRHPDTRNDPAFGLVLEPYTPVRRVRDWANGSIVFTADFTNDAWLASLVACDNARLADGALQPIAAEKPGVVVVQLATPYVFAKGSAEVPEAEKVELSWDGGASFVEVAAADFSEAIRGWSAVQLRISFRTPLKVLRVEGVFQNNPGALPYLSPGRNTVAVGVADAKQLGRNRLVVTYAYRLGSRSKPLDELCVEGKEIAMGHAATWDETITYARKTFTAAELPASFVIDCPTPKGRHPVYPRMLFLQREIVGPNGTPAPLPAGAVEARPAAADELQTLPNPFLVGSAAGDASIAR